MGTRGRVRMKLRVLSAFAGLVLCLCRSLPTVAQGKWRGHIDLAINSDSSQSHVLDNRPTPLNQPNKMRCCSCTGAVRPTTWMRVNSARAWTYDAQAHPGTRLPARSVGITDRTLTRILQPCAFEQPDAGRRVLQSVHEHTAVATNTLRLPLKINRQTLAERPRRPYRQTKVA